jgi:serine/threonine-protein kinase RsbW
MADEWPLQSFLELGALPGAVPSARLHTRQIVFEWGLTPLERSAELVVSELVTNAVIASQSGERTMPVRLWLLSDMAHVLILVHDTSAHPPVLLRANSDAERGRGLVLIDALTQQWGWYAPSESDGKVVWALIGGPVPAAAG